MTAQAERTGGVTGHLETAGGERIEFELFNLPLMPPAELVSSGLTAGDTKYRDQSLVPDRYVAVITQEGTLRS